MATSITGGSAIVAARVLADIRQKESVKVADDGMAQSADVDDGTPAALQQKLVDMADDMASVATQFRNRRDLENKGAASSDGFERVLDDEAAPKAQKLVEVLAVQNLTMDTLLAQARSLFPDDSDLYLVLKELLKRRQLSALQRKRLEGLLDTVSREADPKKLKGGINCALKARLFGATLSLKASLLRQTYRRFLESDRMPLEDYEDWIASYGYKVRHIVLEFVEESLGTDIRAEDPSCNHLEFSYLLAHMRKLQVLRGADREFVLSLLEKKLTPLYGEEEADWLLLLCSLVRRETPAASLLPQALDATLLSSYTQRSTWLNAVRSAWKRLPPELFELPGGASGGCPEAAAAVCAEVLAVFDQLIDYNYAAELQEQRRLPT
ncbi:type III secretion system gatekeeper subunit SctW [Solimicrobium silvestre]|uniref:LcrE: type III secretion regulator YopN/LcrE/InvE/MxiC n=1 Tax=Solimicrobium silvestre TaxID=2099400 RepID=A0A2S9H1M2_9BURK|nr:type III secretion system gatekeeper subunit SctW [Solimicrobium silvestre]PRC93857.1 LcrE: type III secretion regulator YopN/LcrE/InvE/MxiC [Solimicrobium silvestre]